MDVKKIQADYLKQEQDAVLCGNYNVYSRKTSLFYFERNKEFLGVLFCTNNIERENTTRSTKAAAG